MLHTRRCTTAIPLYSVAAGELGH